MRSLGHFSSPFPADHVNGPGRYLRMPPHVALDSLILGFSRVAPHHHVNGQISSDQCTSRAGLRVSGS